MFLWKFIKIVFMLILIFVTNFVFNFYQDDCKKFYKSYEKFYLTDYKKNEAVMIRNSVNPEIANIKNVNAVYKFEDMEGIVISPLLRYKLPQSALKSAKVYRYVNGELDYFTLVHGDSYGFILLVSKDEHSVIPVFYPYENVKLRITSDVRKKIKDKRTSFIHIDKVSITVKYSAGKKTEVLIGTW